MRYKWFWSTYLCLELRWAQTRQCLYKYICRPKTISVIFENIQNPVAQGGWRRSDEKFINVRKIHAVKDIGNRGIHNILFVITEPLSKNGSLFYHQIQNTRLYFSIIPLVAQVQKKTPLVPWAELIFCKLPFRFQRGWLCRCKMHFLYQHRDSW